ncbi:MAG: tetratricopeptide repeat protein [Syntrophales bacterium]
MIYYNQALQINPNFKEAHNNMGIALVSQGRIEEGIFHFRKALMLKPDYILARNNLELVLRHRDKVKEKYKDSR